MMVCLWGAIPSLQAQNADDDERLAVARERATAFLRVEVPRWRNENQCYSCHNNGDAARALLWLEEGTNLTLNEAWKSSLQWWERPGSWHDNGGDEEFSDKRLAIIQFGFGLWTAFQTGHSTDLAAMRRAAKLVADEQAESGNWIIDATGNVGSPVTYGDILATVIARRILVTADTTEFMTAIERADHWLGRQTPRRVPDAAAMLLYLQDRDATIDDARVQQCLTILRQGQGEGGGWGPFVTSPPEPFDTALVILALRHWPGKAHDDMVVRGRRFLAARQLTDGSWMETTRPPGAQSYAQRLSTAGWATWALVAKAKKSQGPR